KKCGLREFLARFNSYYRRRYSICCEKTINYYTDINDGICNCCYSNLFIKSRSTCTSWWIYSVTCRDRKSTRLNSSHVSISYAVFQELHPFPTRRSSDLKKCGLREFLARFNSYYRRRYSICCEKTINYYTDINDGICNCCYSNLFIKSRSTCTSWWIYSVTCRHASNILGSCNSYWSIGCRIIDGN